jgi:hypothetical protein
MLGLDHTTIIEIKWDGPFNMQEAKHLNNEQDYGLYQLY